MFIIQEKLVSSSVVEEQFVCKLDECKGACCWEGDFGAPLEPDELMTLAQIYPEVRPFLRPEGIHAIEMQGTSVYIPDVDEHATPLINNRDCAYLTFDQSGIALCGIEKAYRAGALSIDFPKPISCHLYPIRVLKLQSTDGLNYHEWEICSAACSQGRELKVPVYQFVKTALIRKYGQDFYDELDAAAQYWNKK